ncbi:MAG: TRAFs-binding domain-containing protein [Planctomycetota bacterium]
MLKPLCFVLMPFGVKPGPDGRDIDFDEVYRELLKPAIEEADLEPIRADEESVGGVIHKPMLERLAMCDYALADLTAANANVFYELGVRHAIRPSRTLLVFAEEYPLPFDVSLLRAVPYHLGQKGLIKVPQTIHAIARQLEEARQAKIDSPVFQFLDDLQPQFLPHEKTDVFQDRVEYAEDRKRELARAREDKNLAAVQQIERELGPVEDVEAGIAIDLMLTYRAIKNWDEMIRWIESLPRPLRERRMVQEQLGFAYNRAGKKGDAIRTLEAVVEQHGPSSETLGILGRVYKDKWDESDKGSAEANGLLDKAIDAYRRGFEADWRDAYPGVNAVTLMELADPPRKERDELLPVVTYAVERKVAKGSPDYWDWATLLELAVIGNDKNLAKELLPLCLANVREPWEPETTANNLEMIRQARKRRGKNQGWLKKIIAGLVEKGN